MNRHDDAINPQERIVTITETCDGATHSFYAIRDCDLGYWRGTGALDEHDAWTRDIGRRAEFTSRAEAIREMKSIWNWRRARSGDDQPFTDLLRKGKAA